MIELLGVDPKEDARKPSEKVEELAEMSPADDAIDEFFAMHKAGDMKAAREAFRSAVKICAMEHNEENEKDEGY